MGYFSIPTIKQAIEGLQDIRGNWLIPAFVFAANDVSLNLVDLSKKHGTDSFLDRFFNGNLLGLPEFPNKTNLLRPRMRDITAWKKGKAFEGDYIVQQATKLWANLLSSRGYREMDQRGYIKMDKNFVALTPEFQAEFENKIPASFKFEDLMVWLYAFKGVPEGVGSWQDLFSHLLKDELQLAQFPAAYQNRFRLTDPPLQWPQIEANRPLDQEYLDELAPALVKLLQAPAPAALHDPKLDALRDDDPVLAVIQSAINNGDSYAFLLAGPPGTGKTRKARQLDASLTENDHSRSLYLQFHPALGYDDFVEGFRPIVTTDDKGVAYRLEKRILLEFADKAAKIPDKLFVLVIDEINRADVARVFGELLTYLEPDYREVPFTLSISGNEVSLPRNLIVIATANPYDRSVTDLDDALLRRFWVIELEPSATLLEAHLQENGVDPSVIRRTLHLFNILNKVFPAGFGHTSFLRIKSVEDLYAVWIGRIRLALKRTLLHDPKTREETVGEIEALLDFKDADNIEAVNEGAAEVVAAGPEQ